MKVTAALLRMLSHLTTTNVKRRAVRDQTITVQVLIGLTLNASALIVAQYTALGST